MSIKGLSAGKKGITEGLAIVKGVELRFEGLVTIVGDYVYH
jgi:hypothetical protein